MTKLSVNINKIALIRNSRGTNKPDLLLIAADCERFGADGITVHPRPDERHVKYSDLAPLKSQIQTEFNIEGYPDERFLEKVLEVRPHQVTLVPDPPGALTSSAGWDTVKHESMLRDITTALKAADIRVSIFIEPNAQLLEAAARTGTDRIEFYTEPYAAHFDKDNVAAVKPFADAAHIANDLGLGINAGHDLNLQNLRYLKQHIPHLLEVSIGHALICDAIYYGLENTIQMYKRLLTD